MNLGDVAASCARTQTIATSGSVFLFSFSTLVLVHSNLRNLGLIYFLQYFCNVTENDTSGQILYFYHPLSLFFHQTASQVWAHQGAGYYAGNCALMSGYGNTADDANVISGPKICI